MQDSLFSSKSKLNTTFRLLRADGFDHVIRAENIAGKCFKICFARNNEGNARLGIIASKKLLPRAVDRNRVKRIIREAFRQHNIKFSKLDLVVIMRRDNFCMANLRIDNLEMLFSQIENRCAEL